LPSGQIIQVIQRRFENIGFQRLENKIDKTMSIQGKNQHRKAEPKLLHPRLHLPFGLPAGAGLVFDGTIL
jgi:hypothetical protein